MTTLFGDGLPSPGAEGDLAATLEYCFDHDTDTVSTFVLRQLGYVEMDGVQ